MTDRFKFRVWNNRDWDEDFGKVYYNAEETYDYLGGNPQIPASSFDVLLENDEWIVEQCTGIKDKNGKLIYEGDIVKKSTHPENLEVFWSDELFGYYLRSNTVVTVFTSESELEIIGNIHEDKELLDD